MKKVLSFLGGRVKEAAGLLGGPIAQKAIEVVEAISKEAETNPEMRKLLENSKLEMARIGLADAEGARLLIREAQRSEDPYVRRVRPTFLYLFYVIIAFNFIIIPILKAIGADIEVTYPNLPEELYWLFGSAFLGYGGFRSFDKFKKLKNGDK